MNDKNEMIRRLVGIDRVPPAPPWGLDIEYPIFKTMPVYEFYSSSGEYMFTKAVNECAD